MKKAHTTLLQMVSHGSLWFLMHSFDQQSSFIKFLLMGAFSANPFGLFEFCFGLLNLEFRRV